MSVQSIASTGYGAVVGAEPNSSEDLNKLDFMTLLIAQIRHQDPMSPMDNQQFISQLTEFAVLEETQGTNSRLDETMALTQSLNNTMMLSLVGRTVTVAGDSITLQDGEATDIQLQSAGSGVATVNVIDATGDIVSTYTVPLTSGMNDVSWDGKTSEGDDAADGQYSLSIQAADQQGEPLDFLSFMSGTVESIRFENGYAIVQVGGEEYLVSEIASVSL